MKSKIVIGVFLTISIILFFSAYVIDRYHQPVLGILSPLAEDAFKNTSQYKEVSAQTTVNDTYPPSIYFPLSITPKFNENIDIKAKAFAVMDRESRELLLASNLTQELPIASVTKIMTALVALENAPLDMEMSVSSTAAEIGEATMGLTSGEILTVEELLYGVMLPSGNDAAEVLAEGVGKGRFTFIVKMNDKAKQLGLLDTFYFNPTGLDGDDISTTSFSTALDLLALTNYALENPVFAKIAATRQQVLPAVAGRHKGFNLFNILQLESAYPGVRGVKPGITDFAKETLVSYAENGNKKVIVVLLGAQNTRDEVVKIYDFIFPKLGVRIDGRI